MQEKQNTSTCKLNSCPIRTNCSSLLKKLGIKNKKSAIPWVLSILTYLSAYFGLLINGSTFFQAFYGTFAFFGGNADLETIKGSFLLSLAALLAPITVAITIIFIFLEGIKKQRFLLTQAENHFVIVGLGHMGLRLANDMLENHKELCKKLVVIEANKDNPHIEELKSKGVIFVIGDGSSQDTLEEARVEWASKVVYLMGSDLLNLEVAFKIASLLAPKQEDAQTQKDTPTLYIHLSNRENSELLMTKRFNGLQVKSFSVYDNAAQTLFMKYPLGHNRDTIDGDNTVKLAVVGLDEVGESVVYRALNLGHFYNKQPIEITIFDENHELKKREFEKRYPLVKNYDGVYWKLSFKDESELYTSDNLPFSQIIFCSKDSSNSYADATRLMRNNAKEIMAQKIDVYLFADIYQEIAVAIDEIDADVFKSLYTFGDLDSMLSYDVIINEKLDKMAVATNNGYNELRPKYATPWENLSHFLKESNRMQAEHLQIKLKVINHFMQNSTSKGDYELLKAEALKRWFKYDDPSSMLWDKIKGAKTIVENVPLDALDRLAEIEHNRWNAFHILHGWKPLKTYGKKDKVSKEHPCLVAWEDLDKVSQSNDHKHDYKSDDVETVIRAKAMSDNVSKMDIDKCHICYMSELIKELRAIFKEKEKA